MWMVALLPLYFFFSIMEEILDKVGLYEFNRSKWALLTRNSNREETKEIGMFWVLLCTVPSA